MRKMSLLAVSSLFLALSACGGGGGASASGSTATTSSSVTGTAAYGKPLADAQVIAIDVKTGQTCGQATTRIDGTYTLNTGTCGAGDTLLFELVGGTPNGSPLESMAIPNPGQTVSGTVNITPLTTLDLDTALASISLVINSTQSAPPPGVLQAMSSPNFGTTYGIAVSTINDALSQEFSTYGINGATFDSVTQTFIANGTGIDKFFDDYPESVPSGNSLALGSAGNYLVVLNFPTSAGGIYSLGGSAFTRPTNGSTSGSGNPSSHPNTSTATDATSCYNPKLLQNGNTITLNYNVLDAQGNTGTLTENHVISGPVTWNSNTAWEDQLSESGTTTATATSYEIDQTNKSGIYSVSLGGYLTTYNPYYNYLAFTTKAGQSYTYNLAITSNGIATPLAETVQTTFNKIYNLTVPAGTFNVCEFTENYAFNLSGAPGYSVIEDLAVGSGVTVRTVTTTAQGTTTQTLASGFINGAAVSP